MAIANDLILACNEQNRAALARIFVIESCNIASFTAGSLQDFTAVTTTGGTDKWYEYEGEFKTKSLNSEGSNENGTATFTNTVEFKIRGLDKTKGKRLQDLIDARQITALVEGTNSSGTYLRAFVVGWDSIIGKEASCMANVSATIEGELSGANEYTVTLTSQHAEIVREYVGTIESNASGTVTFGS